MSIHNEGENYSNFFEEIGHFNNTTKLDAGIEYPDFSQIKVVRITFISLFLVEAAISMMGNLCVSLTVYKNKSMHTPVNYYIVNLSVCDFLVGAVVLPVKLFELTADAELNMMTDKLCTTVRFFEAIVVFASVFTLVGICFERYNAIVHPVQSRISMSNLRTRRVLTVVWVTSCVFASPNLHSAIAVSQSLYSKYGEFNRVTCFDRFSDNFRFWYFMSLFVLVFLIPLGFIAVTCFSITRVLLKEIPVQTRRDARAVRLEQGRRKVAKMVLIVVLSFVLSWSPYFAVTLVTQLQSDNFLHFGQYFFTMLLINLFAFGNSCINPCIYFAMSARFRKGFLGIFHCSRNCSRPTTSCMDNTQSNILTTNALMSSQTPLSVRHAAGILITQGEEMELGSVHHEGRRVPMSRNSTDGPASWNKRTAILGNKNAISTTGRNSSSNSNSIPVEIG
ncbi:QRFP-like peptide receptor [Folsomia candida]|uniref:QRFP-like peptide receptor n=1 Tax=Folsomia candida TaxID=158441 RepID=UPI001604C47F|nr:QRFP-like peptide receptor [Folsomia candida]